MELISEIRPISKNNVGYLWTHEHLTASPTGILSLSSFYVDVEL